MKSVYQLSEGAEMIDLYEAMATRIEKVHALIALALEEQLFNGVNTHQSHYLWVVCDLMNEIRELSLKLLHALRQWS